ncbi:MAG TPA: CBS domain-containing protein [Saprospiraceae bacterium]|nr:CBS domain-containing protein [Saprospiraceae bacterium]
MLTVQQLLHGKRTNTILSVRPDQMVIEALEVMATHNIGAVMVVQNGQLVGIFSERDYARKGILQERKAKSTPISEVMTAGVVVVNSKHTIEDCMKLMSERHFRHLPVVDEGHLVGLVSISDIVTAIIREQASRIQSLEQYITGSN